jgi:hypothetical protein
MKHEFYDFLIGFIGFFAIGAIAGCALNIFNVSPEFTDIDPKAWNYVQEYKKLAKIQGIEFKNNVNIGFKKINQGTVIGLTTYGHGFREIAIDEYFWSTSTLLQKEGLLLHELNHAYCTRSHDYAKGKEYPKTEEERRRQAKSWTKPGEAIPGYYTNGCPLSLMYPTILDDYCMMIHYNDYVEELFERCKPW